MCLAIPGKIVEIYQQGGLKMARVEFGGIFRETCLEYVPEAQVGEYCVIHVGFAISVIDEEEANKVFHYLEEMDELRELNEAGL